MASPVIYNLALNNISAFDNVITGVGSTVATAQVVGGQSVYNYIDKDGNNATVTVTRPISGRLQIRTLGLMERGLEPCPEQSGTSGPASAALGGSPAIPWVQ